MAPLKQKHLKLMDNYIRTTDNYHKVMVANLAKSGNIVLKDLTPENADLWHGATGVCTEAGELLDAVKKTVIYNKILDKDNIIEELGDIEFYLEQVRQNLNITREATLVANIAKLEKRYGKQYSDQKAQERADKICQTCGGSGFTPIHEGMLSDTTNCYACKGTGKLL